MLRLHHCAVKPVGCIRSRTVRILLSLKMKFRHQLSPKSQTSLSHFIIFAIISIFLWLVIFNSSKSMNLSLSSRQNQNVSPPTSINHVVFGIASNQESWPKRKDYVKLWWRPRQMRGCVFLESMPPASADVASIKETGSLPPVCISGNTDRFRYTDRGGLRSAIRVARVVSETVGLNHSDVRWFVFGDDDTVFFPENLVKALSKYDHELWYYVGANSENVVQNTFFSFETAFGGAGFAISYPLAKVLAKGFDSCLERYPHLFGSDGRVHACVAELGIGLTRDSGFHQIDFQGNIFGLLAAHPNTPLVSLHHVDHVDPIFPFMTKFEALEHLLEAAKADPQRLLQQTVCYDRVLPWTISVSWGYAVQVFGNPELLPDVIRVQRTFRLWNGWHPIAESFIFDTAEHHQDPCQRPTVFFFDTVDSGRGGGIKSNYSRRTRENCSLDVASAPRKLEEIRVWSNKLDLDTKQLQAPRRHCCDVLPSSGRQIMEISIRECKEEEWIYKHA